MPNYAREFVPVGLPLVIEASLMLEQQYVRSRQPNIAARIRAARLKFERDLRSLSTRYSKIADQEIKRVLASDPVSVARGTSGGRRRGGRGLRSHIKSRPLAGIPGGVGVGDIDELQKAQDPDYPQDGSYWKVQERGYSGHVGREVYGHFYNSPRGGEGYAPSQDRVRSDAFFRPESPGHKLRIKNPIPAKFYLRDGSAEAGAKWMVEYDKIEARFLRETEVAVLGSAARGGALLPPRSTRRTPAKPRRRPPGRRLR